jgi:hypothetical protein
MPGLPSDAIAASEIGQRFALNFGHCWSENRFIDKIAIEQFLRDWWKECLSQGQDEQPDEAFALLVAAAARRSVLCGRPVSLRRTALARVVSFTAFYSPPTSGRAVDHSFLRSKYLSDNYGVGLKSVATGQVFRKLERANGDLEAIRPGAQVRGQMPLSWVTSRDFFEAERIADPRKYSGSLAIRVCRRLGLEGQFYLNSALFQLNYPKAVTHTRDLVRRATAIEGIGNRYFRARRDGAYSHDYGYTVDLNLFEASKENVDGAIEVVLPSLDFTDEFTWQGIGLLLSETAPANEAEFKERLTVEGVADALREALNIIDGLCL